MLEAKTCHGATEVRFSLDEETQAVIDELKKQRGKAEGFVDEMLNLIDAHVTTAVADLACIVSSMYSHLIEANPLGMLAGTKLRETITEHPEVLFSFAGSKAKSENESSDDSKADWRDSGADFN